jgi:hypothetical protein
VQERCAGLANIQLADSQLVDVPAMRELRGRALTYMRWKELLGVIEGLCKGGLAKDVCCSRSYTVAGSESAESVVSSVLQDAIPALEVLYTCAGQCWENSDAGEHHNTTGSVPTDDPLQATGASMGSPIVVREGIDRVWSVGW